MNKKVILYSRVGSNALGQLRSFGQEGYDVIIVYCGKFLPTELQYSKFTKVYHCIPDLEESIQFIIDNYGDEIDPMALTIDSDGLVSIVDKYYDKLKNKFIFFNAGMGGATYSLYGEVSPM